MYGEKLGSRQICLPMIKKKKKKLWNYYPFICAKKEKWKRKKITGRDKLITNSYKLITDWK